MQTQQATEPVTESVTDLSYVDITPKGIYAALAKAQGAIPTITKGEKATVKGKTRDGRSFEYEYSYAGLASVLDAVRLPLADNEIALVQNPITQPNSTWVEVETLLFHSDGSFVSCRPGAQAKATDPQSLASAITYLRRYGLMSLMGIAAEDDDDDGKAASQPRQPQQTRRHERSSRPASSSAKPQQPSSRQPETMEMDGARQGQAPPTKASQSTISHFWGLAKKLNWAQINTRDVLGVTSLDDMTDFDLSLWCDHLKAEKEKAHAVTYEPEYQDTPNNPAIRDFEGIAESGSLQDLEQAWSALQENWPNIPIFQRYWFSRIRHSTYVELLKHVDSDAFEDAYAMVPSRYLGKSKEIQRIHKERMKTIKEAA